MQAGREIKFQVWDQDAKKMWTWEDIIEAESAMFITLLDILRHDQFIKRQYTGLRDKNGKEIYEGDILTSTSYPFQDDGKYNYHGLVEWDDEYSAYFLTKHLANRDKQGISHGISETLMEYDISEFEIIGNIYENPELLEVGNDAT